MEPQFHSKGTNNYFEIKNNSDLYFELKLKSDKGTPNITLFPNSAQTIVAEAGQQDISYEVVTAFTGSDKHLVVTLPVNSK